MNALDLFDPKDMSIPNERFMGIFAGESGTGKDVQAISFVKAGEVFIADCDHRIRGIIPAKEWLGDELFSKITFKQYDVTDGFKELDNDLANMLIDAKRRQLKYKTIVLDSVGSLSFMFLLDSMKLQGRLPHLQTSKFEGDSGSKGRIRGAVSFATPDDWNYVGTAWRQLVFTGLIPLFKCGINIIMSCWIAAKWGKDPNAPPVDKFAPSIVIGERALGPSLNLSEEIPGYFDEVYRFIKDEKSDGSVKYSVKFNGNLAKSVYNFKDPLTDKKINEVDVTEKCFYDIWKSLIQGKGKDNGS